MDDLRKWICNSKKKKKGLVSFKTARFTYLIFALFHFFLMYRFAGEDRETFQRMKIIAKRFFFFCAVEQLRQNDKSSRYFALGAPRDNLFEIKFFSG